MTAWYPPARRREITPGTNDPRIRPVGVVLHVAATNAESLHDFFDGPSGGIESHLYLRKDGTWEQYRDFEHEADAQFKGNSWVSGAHRNGFISVETQGLGAGEWTDAQIREIKKFLAWASNEFGFPLRRCPSMQPDSPAQGGVGYHTMFAGWSNVAGKTCPGPDRIEQFKNVLIPWMKNGEDPVTADDIEKIAAATAAKILDAREAAVIDRVRKGVQGELGDENVGELSDRIAAKVAERVVVKQLVVDSNTLAAAVADVLSARLAG